MNTISLSDFTKLATVLWDRGATSVERYMLNSGLVKVTNIPANSGDRREFSEIDINEYLHYKGQSDQAARGQVQQGYTNTAIAYRIADNFGISWEMRKHNKYPEVVSTLTNAGQKGWNRIDLDLSHRITFGASTSYTDMDGRTIDVTTGGGSAQQLFDTDHPLAGSTTTYRNRLANNPRLSNGAIEGMERLVVEQTYNQFGELKTMPFDIMFVTADPNTVNSARKILQSSADPEGAHSGVKNVNATKYRLVILPRVATTAAGAADTDKRYYWGLASSAQSNFHLGIWESPHMIAPSANSNAEDVQTDKQLSLLWETIVEKLCKFRETLYETILSETQKWGRATTIKKIIKKEIWFTLDQPILRTLKIQPLLA